ncbi:MAG: neutral/alkaline non-lysosomal ceramidase N-terminal domain-containing protein [Candidatus Omnitrophica bacterium]|nr:neutral/alkaline non-lysosomal ceramidase N-terminal domain-containing protein [Candidatus Omnitrophota bacterium]
MPPRVVTRQRVLPSFDFAQDPERAKRVEGLRHPMRPRAGAAYRAPFAAGAWEPWLRVTRCLLAGFVLWLLCLSVVTAAEPQLLVGTAKRDLTPPVKTPLAGYSRRGGKPATGTLDPVSVRAVVLQAQDTTVALVSCDLLIIDERLFEAVKARVRAGSSRPIALLLAATHTHSGPGAYGQKFLEKLSMGHFDPAVFDFLVTRIAQAILEARATLQPASVRYAAAPTEGLVVNRMQPDGVVDAEVTVLAFEDRRGAPRAIVVSFGAHPTTLGAWNMRLSADYPGVLARAIEERYPEAMCLFLAGAVGDQAPVKQGERFERPKWLGEQLASRVLALLAQATQGTSDSLQVVQRTVALPPARIRLGPVTLPSWLGRSLVDDDASVSVVKLDRIMVFGLPCDVSAELGLDVKQRARRAGYQPVVVGFANDYIGYCLPERLYRTISYEASLAFNGPTTGSMLVEELKRMMGQLSDQ